MKLITANKLNRFWQKGIKPIKTLLGTTDISKIGNGTVTGAINELNTGILRTLGGKNSFSVSFMASIVNGAYSYQDSRINYGSLLFASVIYNPIGILIVQTQQQEGYCNIYIRFSNGNMPPDGVYDINLLVINKM